MAEALTSLLRKGGPEGGVETDLLEQDVPRVGSLPSAVVIGEHWVFGGGHYAGETRTAFELHLEANGGAWRQSPNDRRYYDFADSVAYNGTHVVLRLRLPADPGALSNGAVGGQPVAWAAASSTWTATAGQYEYRAPIAANPIPTIGEFAVAFTAANGVAVWYPQGAPATAEGFSAKDAHILTAFDTEGYADIPDAVDQGGLFTSVPDLSQASGRSYGNTFSWTGSTSATWYKAWRVPVARRPEVRSFHAKVGNSVVTTLTILGDLAGYTYGYITLHGYVANSVISLQALGKVSVDTARLDVSGWNTALGFYMSGTYAALPSGAPAGSQALVYGDIVGRNGTYYRLNTGWTRLGGLPGVFATKAAMDAVASPPGAFAMVVDAAARGVYLRTATGWLQVGNVASGGGGGVTVAQVLAALASTEPAGNINRSRIPKLGYASLPDALAYLGKAFRRGGEKDWPDNTLQMGQFIRQAAFSNLPQNYGFRQGNAPDGLRQVAVRDSALGGVEANNVHVLIRASKTAYPDRPAIDDLPTMQFRLGYEGSSPVIRPVLTAVAVADDNYWYLDALIPTLPADANAYMEVNEPPVIDAVPEDGTIRPAMLSLEGAVVEGGYYSYHDGQFQLRRAAGWDQLYRGSQGITLNGLAANSPLVRIAYDGPFNLNRAHDGYYLFEATLTWVAGHDPTTLAFDTDGGDTVSASGQVALFQVKGTAAYDGASALGEVGLRIPVYAGSGSDTHIGDVVYRSDRAANYDGASSVRFEPVAGHGVSGTGGSISAQLEIWYISSGAASAGAHIPNGISTLFGFDDALPLATSYQVGTAVLVDSGADGGLWRNRERIVEGTGLGLAGLSFDYQYDAVQRVIGDRTWHILARNAFTLTDFSGTNFPAYGDLSDWPAELEFIAFGYLTQGRSDGRIYIGFNADQDATNNVQFVTGGAGIAIVRQDNRLWRATGISAAQVGHIRQGVWAFTEPNATGTTRTQEWHQVAPQAKYIELLDWTPNPQPELRSQVLYEVPAGQALVVGSVALADVGDRYDDWKLDIELQMVGTQGGASGIWSMEEAIRVAYWMSAANNLATATMATVTGAVQGGVFFGDQANGTWSRFVLCKGPNGRIAIIVHGPTGYLARLRVSLHT